MCNRSAYYKKWKHFHHGHPHFRHRRRGRGMHLGIAGYYPPVNIKELDDRYLLYVYAPGLSKTDFQVSVADKILTIKVEKGERNSADGENWRRREYRTDGFKREFELNEKIDADAINAEYKDGVLLLTLPKREGFETVRQEIDIV